MFSLRVVEHLDIAYPILDRLVSTRQVSRLDWSQRSTFLVRHGFLSRVVAL
jgi:hypothetical protein